jgi:hypothetical protein
MSNNEIVKLTESAVCLNINTGGEGSNILEELSSPKRRLFQARLQDEAIARDVSSLKQK